jgi:hypothetical protein
MFTKLQKKVRLQIFVFNLFLNCKKSFIDISNEKINFEENFVKLTANWHFSRFIILINLRQW